MFLYIGISVATMVAVAAVVTVAAVVLQ